MAQGAGDQLMAGMAMDGSHPAVAFFGWPVSHLGYFTSVAGAVVSQFMYAA